MRVVVLSDYGGEQLNRSEQLLQGAAADEAAWQSYYQHACGELEAARRGKSLWKRMLSRPTAEEQLASQRVGEAWQQVQVAGYGVDQAQARVQQQGAGVYGEELLTSSVSTLLPHEWVMLRGYRNRRGETDHVLVGPAGVWAVEVKRRRVLLHAVGDRWWYEKTSSRGRSSSARRTRSSSDVYEQEWAVDSSGRSWSRQVGDVAEDLAKWLGRQGHHIRVRPAVMLMHERAQLVECVQPGVDFVGTDPWRLVETVVADPATPLDRDACEAIVGLVERDHHFHARRRRAR